VANRRGVVWTPEARRSLDEVLDFVARDSRDGATNVLEQALAAARSLETLADRGRIVPELADGSIREIFVYRYRLMYRVQDDAVVILAFIHGARDFERWRFEISP
jgi:plasmid stabilization system protein ParE